VQPREAAKRLIGRSEAAMTKRNRSAVASATLVAFSLLVPCVAKAQRMAPAEGSKFAVQQSAHSQPIRVHAVSMRAATGNRNPPRVLSGVRFNTVTNSFEASDGSFVSLQDLLNPVPGFGFDYHHLSVINQDLGIKAVMRLEPDAVVVNETDDRNRHPK